MQKVVNNFSWKVAGAAGDGILSAGMLFAKMCVRAGLHVFATAEYPSLIRGGHNHLDVRVSGEKVSSQSKHLTLLIALNQDSFDYHASKVVAGGGIIYDADDLPHAAEQFGKNDVNMFHVPLKKIANEHGGIIMRNTIAMGATIGLLDFDLELFDKIMDERFGKKNDDVIAANVAAAKAGYDYVKKNYLNKFNYALRKQQNKGTLFMTGNEAVSIGAIKGGCKFFSAYPMTPASSLLHYMAANEKEYGLVVKHTEDEISAINMAIGASFAGARSMTSTSGGGFALMVEAFGLAAMTEIPIVVVEAQRPGPATGMATHSGQADLQFILHAAPDEFPRIIMSPGDLNDCFYETIRTFNLADKYQMPAVILTDKYLGESYQSTDMFNMTGIVNEREMIFSGDELKNVNNYRRYKVTETGISPRALPGTKNGMHIVSSYEHDEKGVEREEEPIRVAMHDKRFRKVEFLQKEIPQPKLEGDENASITIIGWGSTKGPIRESLKLLKKYGLSVNYLPIVYLSPFPSESVKKILSKSKIVVDIENNKTGQLASLIKEQTGIDAHHIILKYDGRAFDPEDLSQALINISEKRAEKIIVIKNFDESEMKNLDDVKMRTFKTMS